MTPSRFDQILKLALRRFERLNNAHHVDVGEHLTQWRTRDYQRVIYDEALATASSEMLYDMIADWSVVIRLALLESEALRIRFLLNALSSAAPKGMMFPFVAEKIADVCTTQLSVEGSLSQRYLLDMLRRAS